MLPSCKFEASRLNIKRHDSQLQQWAFDVHCIALSREQRIMRSFSDYKGWNDGRAEAAVKHVLG